MGAMELMYESTSTAAAPADYIGVIRLVRHGERSSEVVTNSLSRAYYGGSGSVTATRKNCYREVAGSCRALPR